MTIQDLRTAIAALPNDMEVLIDGYEMGLIEPKSVGILSVFKRSDAWCEMQAPMLGTHDHSRACREQGDGEPFDAFCIERP